LPESILALFPGCSPECLWQRVLVTFIILLGILFIVTLVTIHLRLRNNRTSKQWLNKEEMWEPRLMDYLAGEVSADEFRDEINHRDQLRFLKFLVKYADRLREHERQLLNDLAEPYLEGLLPGTRSDNIGDRAQAIRILGTLGLPQYQNTLMRTLRDDTLVVRMVAAQTLIHNEKSRDAHTLMGHLNYFDDVSEDYLASLLAKAGNTAGPNMRTFLAHKDNPTELRAIAAHALYYMNDSAATHIASSLLAPHIPPRLMLPCLNIISVWGSPEHAPSVRKLFPIKTTRILASACRALGKVGDQSDIPSLLKSMQHPSPWVNMAAAHALGDLNASDKLIPYLYGEPIRAELARMVMQECIDNEIPWEERPASKQAG
jgi:hypothetical protein